MVLILTLDVWLVVEVGRWNRKRTIKYMPNLGKMPLVNKFTNLHQNFAPSFTATDCSRHKNQADYQNFEVYFIHLFLMCLDMSAEETFGREACRKGVDHMARNSNVPQQDRERATL